MTDVGWLSQVGAQCLNHDRGTKFCGRWKEVLAGGCVETVPIPLCSPNLNSFYLPMT
jgi:hypothetical protein